MLVYATVRVRRNNYSVRCTAYSVRRTLYSVRTPYAYEFCVTTFGHTILIARGGTE